MISNFPSLFIAFRYLKPSKNNSMVSIISLFSFLGIVLGVGTLIIKKLHLLISFLLFVNLEPFLSFKSCFENSFQKATKIHVFFSAKNNIQFYKNLSFGEKPSPQKMTF